MQKEIELAVIQQEIRQSISFLMRKRDILEKQLNRVDKTIIDERKRVYEQYGIKLIGDKK